MSVEKEREKSEKLLQDAMTAESERSEQRLKEQHERLTAALEEEQGKQQEKMQQALKEAQEQHQVPFQECIFLTTLYQFIVLYRGSFGKVNLVDLVKITKLKLTNFDYCMLAYGAKV